MKCVIMAIDYYMEVEPLSEITKARTTNFVCKNIICRFGVPHSLVSDNGTQFNSVGLHKLCSKLGIQKHFSNFTHHGHVKAMNKTIKKNLERKLEGARNA